MIRAGLLRVAPAVLAAAVLGAEAPAPPPSPSPSTREAAYRLNNVGVSLLEQFHYEDAVTAFRKALALRPTLAIGRANLALALLNAQRLPEARAEAMEAARLLPGAAQPPYALALAARSLGDVEEARSGFLRVLQIDARDVGAHVNLGQILMQERKYAEAAAEFQAALSAEPYSATAAYNLGLALARAGRAEESQAAMDRFAKLREGGYGTTLGQSYPDQGRYAEAIVSTGAEADLVDRTPPPVTFVDVTARRIAGPSVPAPRAGVDPATGGGIALADLDGDGRLDIFVSGPEGPRLYLNGPAGFEDATARWGISAVASENAVAGDYDNDGRLDLLVLRAAGVTLLHNEGGRFSDRTADTGLAAPAGVLATAAFVDADHDGDLDVVLAGPSERALLQNDGAGRFKDVTVAAGLRGRGAAAVVPTDFDNRRDVDLLFARAGGPLELAQNRRDGTFRDVAAAAGLAATAAFRCVAAGDVNKDSFTDLFFGVEGAADRLALSDGRGGFRLGAAPAGSAGTLRALFLDYDNDGLLDLVTVSPRGPRLLRNLGSEWADVTATAFGARAGAWPQKGGDPAIDLAAADLDGDGDTDLVLRLPSGSLRVLDNQGGRNRSLPVRLQGLVSNRGGTGAKVEMRAGSLQQKLETYAATPAPAPADVVFGLGPRDAADAVRVLWPSGVLQTELVTPAEPAAAPAVALTVKELDRKPSSCPFLYAWNGRRFEFVTDFMGGGEMGYWEGPGLYNHPDPDEYVRIRGDQLQAREGRYELRVTNELEEAVFLDRLSLLAVAHPADMEVFPDEGMRATPPAFRLYAVKDLRPPLSARDDAGRDLGPSLRALDQEFADGFPLHRLRGYALEHGLVLDLGPEAGEDTVLLLTGFTDYAFSSDNVAARQAGLALQPPRLETEMAPGVWKTAIADAGIPVGRPQTLVVPMAGRWSGPSRRVRIVTNMRIYWDQARVGTQVALPQGPVRLEPARAQLAERGFSAPVSRGGRDPFSYDYDRVSAVSPWKALPGRYTRPGDVLPLLAATDDIFVISPPGDEVAVSFDAAALPPVPAGWTRSFLLFADGFSKEMDIHSASPDVLGPLPYHGMPSYPYAAPFAYPMTPARAAWLERYNTRVVRAPMARLDAVLAPQARP